MTGSQKSLLFIRCKLATAASALLVLTAAVSPVDHPRTFLLSIENLPLHGDDRVEGFAFSTWGIDFNAVCHIPVGWTIKAGGSLTPEGSLEGQGSLGTTWFMKGSPPSLQKFVLVTLYAPVQRADIKTADGSGVVPATFNGSVTLWNNDDERKVPLTYRNVKLTPARQCSVR